MNKARALLENYVALSERRYSGDIDAIDELIDLDAAIKQSGLTARQEQALKLRYFAGYDMAEMERELDIRQSTASKLVTIATNKINDVYRRWAILDKLEAI